MDTAHPIVGVDLAQAVARALEAGRILADSHRDYCGVGLQYHDGRFIYAEVYDGDLMSERQAQKAQASGAAVQFRAFATRAEFVAWLAAQSDVSLSGQELSDPWLHNNQRLTIARLTDFVRVA